jgi:hypothetical protein
MSETTAPCIRGCSMYRRHKVECEDRETCRGCLPRRATHGNLCDTCHRRLELMLTDAGPVYRWLTGNMASGQGAAPDGDHVTGSREQPLPIKADLYDLRQLLADRLALYVDDWVEHKGLQGPGRHSVEGDAKYLLTWLPGLCKLEWIDDWWEELAETMSNAHALAPWRPTMQRCKGVPCPNPDCGETNLAIFGGESDATCLSCRTMITEQSYGLWVQIIEQEREVAS